MSTSRRTRSLRRTRASESLRTLAWDTSTPSTSPSYRRDRHALQAGDLSASHGTSSDQSISVDGLSSRADDLSSSADSNRAAHGSTRANHGSVRAAHGSIRANHLLFSADLPEQTDPIPRWREGLLRDRVEFLGLRAVKDAVLALLRCTLTLVQRRSLVSISSSTTQAFGGPGESRVGGGSREVYAREHPAPIADSLQHSQSLSSELRDWVVWDRAGLVGSNRELSAGANDLGELDDYSGALEDYAGTFDVHAGALGDHTSALDDDIGTLDNNTGGLGDDTGTRSDGADVLDVHINALDDRTGTLDEQTGGPDDDTTALDDDDSVLDEYTDARDDQTGPCDEHPGARDNDISNPVNDAISKILRLDDEAIRKASVSMGIRPAGETDPSWCVWKREASYVAENEGPSTFQHEGAPSSKRDGPSTSKLELGPSSKSEDRRPTPSPVSLNAGESLPTPIFDSPETFSTRRTTPSPTKVALPHVSPHPQPLRPASIVPPPFASPSGDERCGRVDKSNSGQHVAQTMETYRRWSSPPHTGPLTPHPAPLAPHPRPSPSVQHPAPSRANLKNVLDALPALSRGCPAPLTTSVPTAFHPNAPSPSQAGPSGPSSAKASNEHLERPTSIKNPPSPSSTKPQAPSTLTPPALSSSAPPASSSSIEIVLSPSSSLRTLPSLAQPARQTIFKLSLVPLGVQKTLQDAEHLAREAKAHGGANSNALRRAPLDDAARRTALDDAALEDTLRRAALSDIARAIYNTRRMLHRNKTTEIKLDKDPKCVDARCYTEGLKGIMGTCAAFSDRLAHDPFSARTCSSDWFCEMRDKIVAQEASIRSAIHALVNHEISEKLTALEDLSQPAN
ncbi:hypothetical protein GGF50DRAFT_60604 [Schizophyllum commune]